MQCLAWSCAAEMHHVARSARSIPIPAAADRTPAPETAPAGRLFSGQCAGNTAEQGNRPKTPVSGGSPRSRAAQSRSKRLFQPKGTYETLFFSPASTPTPAPRSDEMDWSPCRNSGFPHQSNPLPEKVFDRAHTPHADE